MSYAALPVIRTPRLTLRRLIPDDADAIAHGIDNFDVSKWLAVVPYPYSRQDALEFIAKVHGGCKPFWAICDAEGLQGIVCLDDELAYWLSRSVWGRGYGFEAARAAVGHWFSRENAEHLESGYFDGNERSGRLLRALGFVFQEKRVRHARSFQQDVVSNRMRLTRRRWQERQDFKIHTPRLSLRPMTPDDAPGLARMATPELARGTGSVVPGWSVAEAADWILPRIWNGGAGFQIAVEDENGLVGAVGFGGAPLSVMYMIDPAHWGCGYATEALSVFLPELFDRFPVTSIAASVFQDNLNSVRIMKKFGFFETGRDMGNSKARLEPAPVITYAVTRETLRIPA